VRDARGWGGSRGGGCHGTLDSRPG
jgi:hypothetical protein